MHWNNVTLELSGKAFTDDSEERMFSVCRTLFSQWKNLTDKADTVSVLLWIADGSEILEYTGDLSRKFEWAYWCGCANPCPRPEHPGEREKRNTHQFPRKYLPDAGPRSYAWLKRLIEVLRETGRGITGKPIRIGATFDNGPEFAVSDFKYRKHREIAQGNTIYPNSFVTCTSRLHADPGPYAAFPDGIPEGISLGSFLGKQFQVFARDLGYDYIWLSNGMGFGSETWGITGALFDKHEFHPENASSAARAMLSFWEDFTGACPGVVIETRGSNFSAGTEIATDACPLRELYRKYRIAPPVNSPWAALNFKSGLEIVAWMSHVAELPDHRFPFRFYIHDPWFMNSPWLDRYGREPWDLFQPLSVSRITAEGKTEIANSISLLSVDDTFGRMPEQVPMEVIPLLMDAFRNAPDAPGPFVWIYPFDEYCGTRTPDLVLNEDLFIGECVQSGFPLNTVISTGNFTALTASGKSTLDGAVLVVPVSAAEGTLLEALQLHLDRGGDVLFYGSLKGAAPELCSLLGLTRTEEISGECRMDASGLESDEFRREGLSERVFLLPQFDGGGLAELPAPGSEAAVLAFAVQNGKKRVAASVLRRKNGGKAGFVRSILPCNPELSSGRNFDELPPDRAFPAERLMRWILPEFGWRFHASAFHSQSLPPRSCISRNDNAFWFSIFAPDTTVSLTVNTPLGAPVLTEMETELSGGNAVWHPGKCWHRECRCFVKQTEDSVIEAKIQMPAYPGYTSRRHYSGFRNAEVRFFVPFGFERKLEAMNSKEKIWNLLSDCLVEAEWEQTAYGPCAVFRNISGYLYFAW